MRLHYRLDLPEVEVGEYCKTECVNSCLIKILYHYTIDFDGLFGKPLNAENVTVTFVKSLRTYIKYFLDHMHKFPTLFFLLQIYECQK